MDPFYYLEGEVEEKSRFVSNLRSRKCPYNRDLDWAGGALTLVERDWLCRCLAQEPADRWPIAKLLAHPYLRQL